MKRVKKKKIVLIIHFLNSLKISLLRQIISFLSSRNYGFVLISSCM
jgi:hypothetical protein